MVVEFGEETVDHWLHLVFEKRQSQEEDETPTGCEELRV